MAEKYLLNRIETPGYSGSLEHYRKAGGYEALKKALAMKPEEVTEVVKASALRGRGGAGFPTGLKWTFMPPATDPRPRYLAVNADESEPGTCKDRVLMERDPHLVLEGVVIAAYAIRAKAAYVYIRGEYRASKRAMDRAIDEARAAGLLSEAKIDVFTHVGAGAYICGEETALMESLEGNRGNPRPKPPFPAGFGLWGQPTTVNNVETLANVPPILVKGSTWFMSLGTRGSPGNFLCGISGHVAKPGVFEVPLGIRAKEILDGLAGGVLGGKKLKALIPGGSSSGFLPAAVVESLVMDHDGLRNAGSMFGTGAMVVMDETTCLVRATKILCQFYHHETCGQCSQCREGCAWLDQICTRIENGEGFPDDVTTMLSLAEGMRARTICALSDAAAIPVQLVLQHFREEFEQHIREKRCPFGNPRVEAHRDGIHDAAQLESTREVHTDVLQLYGMTPETSAAAGAR